MMPERYRLQHSRGVKKKEETDLLGCWSVARSFSSWVMLEDSLGEAYIPLLQSEWGFPTIAQTLALDPSSVKRFGAVV